MTFKVTAISLNRLTRKQTAPPHDELIDTGTNTLFADALNACDVELRYEAFWNDLNPRSKDIVKVIGVEDVDQDSERHDDPLPDFADHILVESQGDWATDLFGHFRRALDGIAAYLGVEFEDGRLNDFAFDASLEVSERMIGDLQAGRTRDVLSVADRPDFCFWTPHRVLNAELQVEVDTYEDTNEEQS